MFHIRNKVNNKVKIKYLLATILWYALYEAQHFP